MGVGAKRPMLSKTGKRVVDLIHLVGASLWLGGFALIFMILVNEASSLLQGAEFGLSESGQALPWFALTYGYNDLELIALLHDTAVIAIPLLMVTGLLYGIATNWGFAKFKWVIAKWIIAICMVALAALLPYNLITVAGILVLTLALFALSVFKPFSKRAQIDSAH